MGGQDIDYGCKILGGLDDRIILPFLRKENLIAEGGFAKIYEVGIEALHDIFRGTQRQRMPSPPLELICNELERADDKGTWAEEFGHEVSILPAFQCLEHPNVISLITAFSKGTTYSSLLPAADGDLRKILNSNHRLPGFQTEIKIFESLWGLCSALDRVHNYFLPQLNERQIGRHYDIKPSNILICDGKPLLSDFGLSRLRRTEDGSRTTFKKGEGHSMHRLVHRWTRDRRSPVDEETVWTKTTSTMALSIPWISGTVDYRFRESLMLQSDGRFKRWQRQPKVQGEIKNTLMEESRGM